MKRVLDASKADVTESSAPHSKRANQINRVERRKIAAGIGGLKYQSV